MTEFNKRTKFDLEERTYAFAKGVRAFIKKLNHSLSNYEDGKQVVRSSGSVGANYIEANEALSKKDFVMRIKICRKEAKESAYWLRLIDSAHNSELESEKRSLESEAVELMKIFGSILQKSK
jgi:four helix bundle protein